MPTPTFDTAYATTPPIVPSSAAGNMSRKAVGPLTRRGDELEADVQGSALRPYRVWIQFEGENRRRSVHLSLRLRGLVQAHRRRAVTYAEQPNAVEIRPPLAETLATLDREQLQALLLKLADRIPRLNDMIETTWLTSPRRRRTVPPRPRFGPARRSRPGQYPRAAAKRPQCHTHSRRLGR
ncbi:MAG: hypothetical protein R3F36_09880 [Candidatus Competibacteraceae bacterium]